MTSGHSIGSQVILVVLIAGVILISVQPPAWAQREPRPDRPGTQGYFFAEFMGGSIGGLMGVSVLEQFFANACSDADDPRLCWSIHRSVFRPLAYPLLVFMGSSAGIVTAGGLAHVQGNVTATLIGSFAGSYGGIILAAGLWQILLQPLFEPGAAEALVEPEETPNYLKRTFPLIMRVLRPHEETIKNTVYITFPVMLASYFGTEGFNVGAQIAPSTTTP